MKKLCVLVVEDCRAEAERLRSQLELLGHHVVLAGSEDVEVQATLERVVPDLALVDISSSGGGLGTADAIRERSGMPVICLADSGEARAWQSGGAGRNVLFAPVNARELEIAMDFALQQRAVELLLRRTADAIWEFAGSGEAIIITDEHCRIRFMNPAAECMTGWSRLEATGLDADCVFSLTTGAGLPPAKGLRLAIQDRLVMRWGRGWVRSKIGEETAVTGSMTAVCESPSKVIGGLLRFSRRVAGPELPCGKLAETAPYVSFLGLIRMWLSAECKNAWNRIPNAVWPQPSSPAN